MTGEMETVREALRLADLDDPFDPTDDEWNAIVDAARAEVERWERDRARLEAIVRYQAEVLASRPAGEEPQGNHPIRTHRRAGGGEMTGDRLRQLADAVEDEVTPGDPIWLVSDDDIEVWAHSADARLIAALGPDAARLLADAMDALQCSTLALRYQAGVSPLECGECSACLLRARFAALGEPS